MTKETKVKPIRTTEEIIKRFDTLTENFPNQSTALEALINAYELQSAKNGIPDRATEIAEYDTHLQAIQRCYLHALDVAQDAESRIQDEFRHKLETLDEEKEELRRKLELAKDDITYYKGQVDAANKTAMEIANEAEGREEKIKLLETTLENERRNAAAQIADKQRLIDSLTAQLAEAHEDARTAEEAVKETDSLKAQLISARQELADAQTAATVAAAKATAAQAEAVAAIQKETSIQLLQLTGDKGTLQANVERMKAQIATLETALALEREKNAAPMNDQQTPPTPEEDTSNVGLDKKRKAKATTKRKAPPKTAETPPMNDQQDATNPEKN